ncbi:MAG TPA: SIS domain-containing protein [Terriglobia bacterium]|nr:SIS domain-containing protein [Terriglobia bacterium]
MSAQLYLERVEEVISAIRRTQTEKIERAAETFASSITSGGRVYLFGSGHSVIPVLDIFPRYGSFVGFCPIYDPRLMWFNVVGPGGARELLWLERHEGYVSIVLQSYQLEPRDSILIFSHGGLNAAPVEMALEATKKGLTVVSVCSHQNQRQAQPTHSSGKKLADASDIAIDNCVPPEDALVSAEGIRERFAAGSTVAGCAIAMALVADTGARLVKNGIRPATFVSPNVGLPPDHNQNVFREYERFIRNRE